jgi:hypothetical protein
MTLFLSISFGFGVAVVVHEPENSGAAVVEVPLSENGYSDYQ